MTCPKDCTIPEDEHYCFARGIPGHKCFGSLTHQHRPRKGMGGRGHKTYGEPSRIVSILCWSLHDQIDNFPGRPYRDRVEDGIYTIEDGERVLFTRELA